MLFLPFTDKGFQIGAFQIFYGLSVKDAGAKFFQESLIKTIEETIDKFLSDTVIIEYYNVNPLKNRIALDESIPPNERSKPGDETIIDYRFSIVSRASMNAIVSKLNIAMTPVDGKKSEFSAVLSAFSK